MARAVGRMHGRTFAEGHGKQVAIRWVHILDFTKYPNVLKLFFHFGKFRCHFLEYIRIGLMYPGRQHFGTASSVNIVLLETNRLQCTGSDLGHQGQNVRPSEMGKALLVVAVVAFLERDARVKGHSIGQHDKTGVEIGLIERIVVDVGR